MLAYIRVVVVWAVSAMALPSSKHCAYNLPRKAVRVKLALLAYCSAAEGTHEPRRSVSAALTWPQSSTLVPPVLPLPDLDPYSARKAMRAEICAISIDDAYSCA